MLRSLTLTLLLLAGCDRLLPLSPPEVDAAQQTDRGVIDLPGAPRDATLPPDSNGPPLPDATPLRPPPWSVTLGGPMADEGRALAVDAQGNIYLAGYFSDTMKLGGSVTLTSDGSSDVLLISLRPDGTLRWSRRAGGPASDQAHGVAVDPAGNVTIVGEFREQIDFGGGPILATASQSDIFVASYDKSGSHRWSKGFGEQNSDGASAVATDSQGNLYVTGSFSDSLDLGGGPIAAGGVGIDIFVASFDSNGAHRWSLAAGSQGYDEGLALCVDGQDRVHVTGYFGDTIGFKGTNLSSAGSADIFLASFDSAGKVVQATRFGGSGHDGGHGVAADSQGNLYLTGHFTGTVSLGGAPLVSAGARDIFLLALDAKGGHRWSRRFGGAGVGYDEGRAVAVDGQGNVFATGFFSGTSDFPDGPRTSKGFSDLYLTSFTAGGGHRWTRFAGGGGNDYGRGLAAPNGAVLLTGTFQQSVVLGGDTLTSQGNYDVLLHAAQP